MVSSFNLILLFSSAIGAALAAPVIESRGSYSISAIHNENFIRNGTAALHKAYAKYHLKAPSKQNIRSTTVSRRQDGDVPAIPAPGDVEYLCSVTIGGQNLELAFDTGSSDLWVFSDKLPLSDQKGHQVFSPDKSSTFKVLPNASWSIAYGDGSQAHGTVGLDLITVGETTVKNQAIEVATGISSSFLFDNNDGLLGLAFSSLNQVQPTPQKTFSENALPSLNDPIFAAYLPFGADGFFDFGEISGSRYSGNLLNTSVDNSTGFWQFTSESYKIGTKTFQTPGVVGIADTGTTLLLMSDSTVTQYYSGVPGAAYNADQEGWLFPCNATLPTLSFAVGDVGYADISSDLLNFGPVDAFGKSCYGSLQSTGGESFNIYGDIFFNAYYTVFNLTGPTFSFAPIVAP